MTEEDFEIDVYGDATGVEDQEQAIQGADEAYDHQQHNGDNGEGEQHGENYSMGDRDDQRDQTQQHEGDTQGEQSEQLVASTPQGMKRKLETGDLPTEPGATNAVLVSELQWWTTEDDVRSWIRDAAVEDELNDVTFSEHKVNGKSKGQTYVEFTSPQAATAAKRYIEGLQFGAGTNQQGRPKISFHSSHVNPFKTLPKDAPQRQSQGKPFEKYTDRQYEKYDKYDKYGTGAGSGPNFNNSPVANNFQAGGGAGGGLGYQTSNYRGGRGVFNRGSMRGGYNNQGFGINQAYVNNMGFNNAMGGGFNRGGMGGSMMGGGMGFNRGGPNIRGRGGMGGNIMGGGPMMGNPMGMAGMMPAMNLMGGGMGGMGFSAMGGNHFNPGNFFGGNQVGGNYGGGGGKQGGSDWGNPHGAKRARGE